MIKILFILLNFLQIFYFLKISQVSLNFKVYRQSISQYRDVIKGCNESICFTYNFISNILDYQVLTSNFSNSSCGWTNYMIIEKKRPIMWQFKICNLSSNGSAAFSVLKHQNLKTGRIFQSKTSTFGPFSNDHDFPWYYSRITRQMILPWYFLHTLSFVTINVTNQKIMLSSELQSRNYMKSINISQGLLYRIEGYPDDSSNRIPFDNNFPSNILQACIVANGNYIVMITQNSQLKIYNTTSRAIFFQQFYNVSSCLIKLNKVNETHVIVTKGGPNAQIKLYDTRIPYPIISFALPQNLLTNFTNSTIITGFCFNQSLIYHSTQQPSKLVVVEGLPIYKVEKLQNVSHVINTSQLCLAPNQIMLDKYCVLCAQTCLTCDPFEVSKCTSCRFGYYLQQITNKCQVNSHMQIVSNIISILSVTGVTQIQAPIFQFMDATWMFYYHKFRYHQVVENMLNIINFLNYNKFFPSSLLKKPLILSTNSAVDSTRDKLLPQIYQHVNLKQQNFNIILENAFFKGVFLNVMLFFLLKLAGCILNRSCLSWLLAKNSINIMLVILVLSPRLSFICFNIFSQLIVPSFTYFSTKIFLISGLLLLFVVIIYILCFHRLVQQYYSRKQYAPLFIGMYKPLLCSYVYVSNCDSLLVMQSFIHSYFTQDSLLQKYLLLIPTAFKIANILKNRKVFKANIHFFVLLFFHVTLFVFQIILILDEYQCSQLFQVEIKTVELLVLGIMVSFKIVQVLCLISIILQTKIDKLAGQIIGNEGKCLIIKRFLQILKGKFVRQKKIQKQTNKMKKIDFKLLDSKNENRKPKKQKQKQFEDLLSKPTLGSRSRIWDISTQKQMKKIYSLKQNEIDNDNLFFASFTPLFKNPKIKKQKNGNTLAQNVCAGLVKQQ